MIEIYFISFLFLFLIFAGCMFFYSKGVPQAELFQLEDNEEIKAVAKGDYYEKKNPLLKSYFQGGFAFTNKRIIFKSDNKCISIPYSEISLIKKSYIIGLIPLSFLINTVYGQTYEFAVWEREKCIDIIYENIRQQ